MSADLFAEFASNPPRPHQSDSSSSQSTSTAQPCSQPDLFSFGFGSPHRGGPLPPVEEWPSLSNNLPGWAPTPTTVPKTTSNDDDDGWGDFETAGPDAPSTNLPSFQSSNSFANSPARATPKNPPLRVPTFDLMTNTLVDLGPVDVERKPSPRPAPKLAPKPAPKHEPDLTPKSASKSRFSYKFSRKPAKQQSSVLFDADDFELQGGDDGDEDDDDYGDFGGGLNSEPASRSYAAAPLVDLLSLDDPPPKPLQAKSRSHDFSHMFGGLGFGATSSKPSHRQASSLAGLDFNMASTLGTATHTSLSSPFSSVSPVKKKHESSKSMSSLAVWTSVSQDNSQTGTAELDDDGWAAWDDMPSEKPNIETSSVKKPDVMKLDDLAATKDVELESHWNWNWNLDAGGFQADAAMSKDDDPPPTNVPPPSVILSMFPDLLSSGDALFKPLSQQNAAAKQKILSSPEAAKFLEGYVLLATTAARVIAGRKHRWHRDKLLAKSMSISAAGSKGMKLAGVDKAQSAKEDREAADVVAAWQEQVGRLRSAVTGANAAGLTNLRVPEVKKSMQVSTAKLVPTSPKACIICGLKRDERVSKVDFDVEDSFGEWWAEHWGHRSCKNFWIEHERGMRQR